MAKSKRTSASHLAESRNTKPLSKAMYNWAKANMSKLKQPTKAQKKIFEKYKAMKAAGDTPANPKPRPKPAPATPSSIPAPATPSSKPAKKAAPASAKRGKAGKPTPKYNVGVSRGGVSFNEAFRHFKNRGQKTFTWNGKKYTTEAATTTTTTTPKAATKTVGRGRNKGTTPAEKKTYAQKLREKQEQRGEAAKRRAEAFMANRDKNRLTPAQSKKRREEARNRRPLRQRRMGY